MSNQKKIQEVIDSFEESMLEDNSNVVELRPVLSSEFKRALEENAKLVINDLTSALNRMREMERQLLCKASEYCSIEQFNEVVDDLTNSLESNVDVKSEKYNTAQRFIMLHTLKQVLDE